ncbi:hypothetical protein CYMTET_50220 [Cymbomonas tetramitiformis]|uniref:Uncharacterized protein n=1 Tax=Cymbomonas tetramitiformis TaxID=36881 RepID=A0AAE0ETX1_9CHLO|nr:hypothetical protein CYMTET_50220 [Cymbomonas tetramitiformis]
MNGVDVCDQLRNQYRMDGPWMRLQKWWFPIFLWTLEVAWGNAYKCYVKKCKDAKREKYLSHRKFLEFGAKRLCGMDPVSLPPAQHRAHATPTSMVGASKRVLQKKVARAPRLTTKTLEGFTSRLVGKHPMKVVDKAALHCQWCKYKKSTDPVSGVKRKAGSVEVGGVSRLAEAIELAMTCVPRGLDMFTAVMVTLFVLTAPAAAQIHRHRLVEAGEMVQSHERHIALCYTGHLRSFERIEVRESHKDFLIGPLEQAGYQVHAFFASPQHPSSKGWETHAGNLSVFSSLVEKVFPSNKVTLELADEPRVPSFIRPEKCGLRGYREIQANNFDQLPRFIAQWGRVRFTFRMLEQYELRHNITFDLVMRIRPDMLYLKEINARQLETLLGQRGLQHAFPASVALLATPVHNHPLIQHPAHRHASSGDSSTTQPSRQKVLRSPPSTFVTGQKLNDWAIACLREDCPGYFKMIDSWNSEETCTESNTCCYGWGKFYDHVLERGNITVADDVELFPATLARPSNVDCNRLVGYDELVELCYKKAKLMGINPAWTCYRNGKIEIHRACKFEGTGGDT